jgi:hypothetical protein
MTLWEHSVEKCNNAKQISSLPSPLALFQLLGGDFDMTQSNYER